jgi:hypothetical protein
LSTSNQRTVIPTMHTTIRIKRDLRLRHASLFTLLNANYNMLGKVTSATSRESRVLLRAMQAPSSIPDRLTIDVFE